MPTSKQMKLRSAQIEQAVQDMLTTDLPFEAYMKSVEYRLRIDVMVLALARGFITPEQVPPNKAREVAEKYLKKAPDRIRDDAAKIGTDVHEIFENFGNGTVVDYDEKYVPWARSWKQFAKDWGIVPVLTEFTVESLRHGYMGCGDLLFQSRRYPELGLILGDYKSSESGIWPDIALQLAAIRYADHILICKARPHADDYEHKREDVVVDKETLKKVDSFVGIQITDKGYMVVPVNVSENTFKVFLAAQIVADWETDRAKNALGSSEFVEVAA